MKLRRMLRPAGRLACALGICLAVSYGAQSQSSLPHNSASHDSASNAATAAPPVSDPAAAYHIAESYRISPDDLLDIFIVDVPEYSRDYRVGSDGTIRLPLLKESIMAAGQTTGSLGEVISSKLEKGGLLNNPRVLVEIKESRSHTIAITGAVRTPQNFPVLGTTTLMNLISQAGGIADDASNTAVVKRGEMGMRVLASSAKQAGPGAQDRLASEATVSINLKKLYQGDASQNIDLYPGDSVVIQRAATIYVVGAVNRSGEFVMNGDRSNMTVLKAVALAENLKGTAESKRAYIIRKNPSSPEGEDEIPVNLDKILSNHAPDQQLIAEDVLYVPDSSMKKALHRAGEAAAQAATVLTYGLAIYK